MAVGEKINIKPDPKKPKHNIVFFHDTGRLTYENVTILGNGEFGIRFKDSEGREVFSSLPFIAATKKRG